MGHVTEFCPQEHARDMPDPGLTQTCSMSLPLPSGLLEQTADGEPGASQGGRSLGVAVEAAH